MQNGGGSLLKKKWFNCVLYRLRFKIESFVNSNRQRRKIGKRTAMELLTESNSKMLQTTWLTCNLWNPWTNCELEKQTALYGIARSLMPRSRPDPGIKS